MPHSSSAVTPSVFRLCLLGTFEVQKMLSDSGGNSNRTILIHLRVRKSESLLAYLALHPEPHSREKLAALFWGDVSDRQARDSLRNAFAVLRKHLGDDLLIATRDSAQLNQEFPLWIDAVEFKRQIDTTPQSALGLYRGELLADFYDDWIVPKRDEYRDLYLDALLRLTQQFRAQSEYGKAIEFAQKILKVDAANERAHQNLMFCYVSTGNRSAALHQYEECKRMLHDELAVVPSPETTALYQWIRQTPSAPAFEARLTNLPIPLTSFIGRQREIGEVRENLANTRLLTLTGAGGSGKTRLAIQVANEFVDSFKDGVWWVELAALTDATLVPQAVAKTLGVQENAQQPLTESLVNYLRSKQLLLVLDNCEHLLTDCAQLGVALLSACPYLQILATSRERLGILGERVWQVPTMSLPESRAYSITDLLINYESIRLFFERAIAVKSDFTLTEWNASTVTEICQRLDGIPLAIEMAAARVQALSLQEIAARLDERFSLLTTGDRIALPRHQTLHALIDWSYDLLSSDEQTLLRRLSVFAGGFTLDAAEEICADETLHQNRILDLLSHLIAKSLVMVEVREGEARYRMLEMIRQYAYEKLRRVGEAESVHRHHLGYFLKMTEDADSRLHGGEQLIWLNRLEAEHDNLRAALVWCLEHDSQSGLQLATSLWQFWILRGYLVEGRQILQGMLKVSSEHTSLRAKALISLARVNFRLESEEGQFIKEKIRLEESLAIYQELDDKRGSSRAYQFLGAIVLLNGEHEHAWFAFEKSLAHALAADSKSDGAASTHFLGVLFDAEGDYSQARNFMEKSLALFRELGDQPEVCSMFLNVGFMRIGDEHWRAVDEETILIMRSIGTRSAIGYTLANLGMLARAEGDYTRAKDLLEASLTEFRASGDRAGVGQVLGQLGNLARVSGDHQQAKAFLEASLELRREIGERRGIGRTLCSLGYLSASEGNYGQAREFFNLSLELFQEMRDQPGIAATLSHLGNMALAEGDYAQAESLYARSYSLFHEIGTNHGMAINLLNLADCARCNGNYPLARSRLEESLTIFQKIRHSPGVTLAKEELRNLAREQEDRGA